MLKCPITQHQDFSAANQPLCILKAETLLLAKAESCKKFCNWSPNHRIMQHPINLLNAQRCFKHFRKVCLSCSINHSNRVLPLLELSFTCWKLMTYVWRYFQPKIVNLSQGIAKSPSEIFAQASNLSNLHWKGRLKLHKELLRLQYLLRKTQPKNK